MVKIAPTPSQGPSVSVSVDEAVHFGSEVSSWCLSVASEIVIEATGAERLASIAFLTTHEHHRGLITLVQAGLLGSAAALLRPVFETFARGLWLCHVKEASLLLRFQEGRDTSDPEVLIRQVIKATSEERHEDLLRSWLESKKSLHCFVHGGYQALIRRSGSVKPPDSEVIALVCFSTAMSLHAFVELAVLANLRMPSNGYPLLPEKLVTLRNGLVDRLTRMGFADPF